MGEEDGSGGAESCERSEVGSTLTCSTERERG